MMWELEMLKEFYKENPRTHDTDFIHVKLLYVNTTENLLWQVNTGPSNGLVL